MTETLGRYTLRIFRFDPERGGRPRYDTFNLDVEKGLTVLDCLQSIKDAIDTTLTFRRSCRSAICGSCAMNINGKNELACHLQAARLPGRTVTVNPLPGYPVVRDLVVEMEEFYRSIRRVMPWFVRRSPRPDRQIPPSPAARDTARARPRATGATTIRCEGCGRRVRRSVRPSRPDSSVA